ncbi:MAG: hypothetical protein ACLQNE_01220 [Thermoguttaceae bacterium]
MARTYAGILGFLAFVTSLVHGYVHAQRAETILLSAWASLVAFAVIGSAAGWTARRVVEDAVRERIVSPAAETPKSNVTAA